MHKFCMAGRACLGGASPSIRYMLDQRATFLVPAASTAKMTKYREELARSMLPAGRHRGRCWAAGHGGMGGASRQGPQAASADISQQVREARLGAGFMPSWSWLRGSAAYPAHPCRGCRWTCWSWPWPGSPAACRTCGWRGRQTMPAKSPRCRRCLPRLQGAPSELGRGGHQTGPDHATGWMQLLPIMLALWL